MGKKKLKGLSVGDYVFIAICVIITIICLLPMVHLLAKSLSGADYLIKGKVTLIPYA